ncbi:hypothetical protein BLA29_012693, partial [Euroglyphus maynei]
SRPRLRDHYQSHRLSYWLNLIPHLLQDQYNHHLINRKQYSGISNSNNHNHHHSDHQDVNDLIDVDSDIGYRYIRHHLLDNFDDENSYDGPVRQITFDKNGQRLYSEITGSGGVIGFVVHLAHYFE